MRSMRVVLEWEVEITDPVSAHAASLGTSIDGEGNAGVSDRTDEEAIAHAVWAHFASAGTKTEHLGFRFLSGGNGPLIRPTDELGYPKFTLPAAPERLADGDLDIERASRRPWDERGL